MSGGNQQKLSLSVVGVMLAGCCLVGCQDISAVKKITSRYYHTQTPDGMTLALRRYQPAKLAPDKNPVILCHGLSYNLLFWDLHEDVSLARYLAGAGYDVWSLSLRGACPSSQPLTSKLRKLAHFNLDGVTQNKLADRIKDLKMTDWSVDDHIRYDVPAAIDFVLEQTEQERLHWIGHSMGGMIMFGHLGQNPSAGSKIKSFVAAAVPLVVFHPLSDPMQLLVDAEGAIDVGSKLVGSSAPATWGALFGDLDTPTDKLFFNGLNTEAMIVKTLNHQAQEEIAPSQLKQLISMVRTERFTSLDNTVDYVEPLGRIDKPICFLVGTVDNMATPDAVRFTYRQIAGEDRAFHLFGRVNGHRGDYGHDDVIIGRHAKTEVYPVILKWLKRHPRRTDESKLLLQPAELK